MLILYKANSKTGRKTITKTDRNSNFPKIHRWTAFHITNDSTTCFVRNNSPLRKRSTVGLDHSIPENSWKIVIGEVSSPDASSGPRYTALVPHLSVRLGCRKTKRSHDRPRNGRRPPFRRKGVMGYFPYGCPWNRSRCGLPHIVTACGPPLHV